jgi:hypothetical protein
MNSRSNSPDANAPLRGRLALRFISGKYQGGEFPLSEGTPIVVGRSSDLDMVLVEEMVSRRHARIEVHEGVVQIEDLGSTNGTFVNGERVQRAFLKEGDRLLIGTSILKLVTVEQPIGSNLQQVAFGKSTVRHSGASSAARMSGNLEEIPLPDLMQLFGTSRKSGVLVIHSEGVGRIYLRDGLMQTATIEGAPEIDPLKAAYRMLAWSQGTFALEPPAAEEPEHPMGLSAQEFLMEGFRQLDELNNLRTSLPAADQRLTLKSPLVAPLHDLEQAHLDVLQLAINAPSLQATLDRSPRSDLETVQALVALIRRGYIQAVP